MDTIIWAFIVGIIMWFVGGIWGYYKATADIFFRLENQRDRWELLNAKSLEEFSEIVRRGL